MLIRIKCLKNILHSFENRTVCKLYKLLMRRRKNFEPERWPSINRMAIYFHSWYEWLQSKWGVSKRKMKGEDKNSKKTTFKQMISPVDVFVLYPVLQFACHSCFFIRAKISLITCSIIAFYGCKINTVRVRGLFVGCKTTEFVIRMCTLPFLFTLIFQMRRPRGSRCWLIAHYERAHF